MQADGHEPLLPPQLGASWKLPLNRGELRVWEGPQDCMAVRSPRAMLVASWGPGSMQTDGNQT